jgi:hypothetical protein
MKNTKEQKSWQEISNPVGEDVHATARRLDGFLRVPMNVDDLECRGSVDHIC